MPAPVPLGEPTFRAVKEDDLAAPRQALRLPSPEELGVAAGPAAVAPQAAAVASVDWNLVRGRLDKMGAVGLHLKRLPTGGYQVSFVLPGTVPGQDREFAATAGTEAAAVSLALQRAEQGQKN